MFQAPKALLLGQLLEFAQGVDQFLEVGLGERRGDLALGHGLDPRQLDG